VDQAELYFKKTPFFIDERHIIGTPMEIGTIFSSISCGHVLG
jgi:hypothetical protein